MSYQKLLQQVIAVTLVILFLAGCGAPSPAGAPQAPAEAPQEPAGAPQEVKDAAIEAHKRFAYYQEKDHQVTCANKLDLTNADQANGIGEKWCARVEYLERIGDTEWHDMVHDYTIVNKNGAWTFDSVCLCK